MPNLCITADDYGMHAVVNDAIESLAMDGHISAVAVMVHPCAVGTHCTRLKPTGVAVGAHLVLTQERPLLESLVGTALAPNGHLPESPYRLIRALAGQPRLYTLLRDELAAQLDRYASLGLPLDFVNSHEHVHQIPALWSMVMQLVEGRHSTTMRSAHVQPIRPTRQGALAMISKVSWRLRPPRAPMSFLSPLGAGQAGGMGFDAIEELVAQGLAWHESDRALPELVVHPAVDDRPLHARYGAKAGQRRAEYDLLRSRRMAELRSRHQISLVAGAAANSHSATAVAAVSGR